MTTSNTDGDARHAIGITGSVASGAESAITSLMKPINAVVERGVLAAISTAGLVLLFVPTLLLIGVGTGKVTNLQLVVDDATGGALLLIAGVFGFLAFRVAEVHRAQAVSAQKDVSLAAIHANTALAEAFMPEPRKPEVGTGLPASRPTGTY